MIAVERLEKLSGDVLALARELVRSLVHRLEKALLGFASLEAGYAWRVCVRLARSLALDFALDCVGHV